MKTLDEMIAVMNAAKEGKTIEILDPNGKWVVAPAQSWNWQLYDYRVQPGPEIIDLGGRVKAEMVGDNGGTGFALFGVNKDFALSHDQIDALYQASRKARAAE